MKLNPNEMLRKIREDMRLSQDALGKILGVNQSTVNNWEKGRRNLPVKIAIKLCKINKGAYTLDSIYANGSKN